MDLDDITLEHIFMLFAILIGLLVVVGLFAAFAVSKQNHENSQKPVRREKVRVVEKTSMSNDPVTSALVSDVWFIFETQSGERIRLCGKTNIAIIGDEGMLQWQGTKLISFSRDL